MTARDHASRRRQVIRGRHGHGWVWLSGSGCWSRLDGMGIGEDGDSGFGLWKKRAMGRCKKKTHFPFPIDLSVGVCENACASPTHPFHHKRTSSPRLHGSLLLLLERHFPMQRCECIIHETSGAAYFPPTTAYAIGGHPV